MNFERFCEGGSSECICTAAVCKTPAESGFVTVATDFYGSRHRHTVHPETLFYMLCLQFLSYRKNEPAVTQTGGRGASAN